MIFHCSTLLKPRTLNINMDFPWNGMDGFAKAEAVSFVLFEVDGFVKAEAVSFVLFEVDGFVKDEIAYVF